MQNQNEPTMTRSTQTLDSLLERLVGSVPANQRAHFFQHAGLTWLPSHPVPTSISLTPPRAGLEAAPLRASADGAEDQVWSSRSTVQDLQKQKKELSSTLV